jgi:hypothetical protein
VEWQLENWEIRDAEMYFFRKATKEVRQFCKASDYKDCSTLKDGVLYYNSRILDGQEIDDVENIMPDISPLSFCTPMMDRWSPVAYSITVHSHHNLTRHRNAVATLREARKVGFVVRGRDLANEIRDSCIFCRRFKAKLAEVEFGKVHPARLTIAPAFFRVQADLCGPWEALCDHNCRSVVEVWGCIFIDPASGAVSAYAMPKYDTGAFLSCYMKHAYRYGHAAKLYIDGGSQLIAACKKMQISWTDLTGILNSKFSVGVEYEVCGVGRHNRHGAVERSIKEVKKIFNLVFSGFKMDLFAYDAAFAFIANELNNMPTCLGSRYDGLEHTDLITANRLLMGRNNRRAPTGYPRFDDKSRQIEQLDRLHKAWWKLWKDEKIVDWVPRPNKWLTSSRPPVVGDIVVFLQQDKEATLGDTLWRLGRVVEIFESTGDDKVRAVKIEYKNASQSVFQTTTRSVRKLAILFREGELEMTEALNEAAREGDRLFIQYSQYTGGRPRATTEGFIDL